MTKQCISCGCDCGRPGGACGYVGAEPELDRLKRVLAQQNILIANLLERIDGLHETIRLFMEPLP